MTRTLPMVEARKRLTSLPESFEKDPEVGAVTVLRRGRPVLAVLAWDFYESLLETLEIASDERQLATLRKGIRELQAGKTLPWSRVKRRMRL